MADTPDQLLPVIGRDFSRHVGHRATSSLVDGLLAVRARRCRIQLASANSVPPPRPALARSLPLNSIKFRSRIRVNWSSQPQIGRRRTRGFEAFFEDPWLALMEEWR